MSGRGHEFVCLDFADGFYWFRNWINLPGGGHVGEWKLARVVRGQVQVFGSDAWLDPACPYLRDALWVRAEPPANVTAVRRATAWVDPSGGAVSERVRAVAEKIVDAFLAASRPLADYYAHRPDHRAELVAGIARQIGAVRL